ncbi:hypothetical protein LCGC14_1860380, partial [marine sediment metagenome]
MGATLKIWDTYIAPASNALMDLGSDALEWKDLWIDGIAYIDQLNMHGALDMGDNDITSIDKLEGVDVNTFIDLGTTDLIDTKGNIIPNANAADDLGSDAREFNNLWIDGKAYIDGLGRNMLVDIDIEIEFGDNAVHISSQDDGRLDLTADVMVDVNGLMQIVTPTQTSESNGLFIDYNGNTGSGLDERALMIDMDTTKTGFWNAGVTGIEMTIDATATGQKTTGEIIGIVIDVRDDSTDAGSTITLFGIETNVDSDSTGVNCYGGKFGTAGLGVNYAVYAFANSGSANYSFWGNQGLFHNVGNMSTDGDMAVNGGDLTCTATTLNINAASTNIIAIGNAAANVWTVPVPAGTAAGNDLDLAASAATTNGAGGAITITGGAAAASGGQGNTGGGITITGGAGAASGPPTNIGG